MKAKNRDEIVAMLNGFLYGVLSLSGDTRDFEGGAYCIEVTDESQPISKLINQYYVGQHIFEFQSMVGVEIELQELEARVATALIRDESVIVYGKLSDTRRYLSFRVMDMIDDIFAGHFSKIKAFELQDKKSDLFGSVEFICLLFGNLLLVLQFNDFRGIRRIR